MRYKDIVEKATPAGIVRPTKPLDAAQAKHSSDRKLSIQHKISRAEKEVGEKVSRLKSELFTINTTAKN